MSCSRFLFSVLVVCSLSSLSFGQSGATSSRNTGREYGVNLTFAVYQYDAGRSPALEEITRLSGTFSTPEEEIAFVKDKHKLEEMVVRHVRSVGLRGNESFSDAVLLGPEYMVFSLTPREIVRGHMKLDLRVRYANEPMLDVKNVDLDSFETVMLRGGKGMFGLKYFVGAGGRQQSTPVERTLLLSVTAEVAPLSSLRNRREELSHPVDEYGNPVTMKGEDRFTPPVALERVAPKFESTIAFKGAVLLTGTITPEGKISNVRVLRSLDPIIDERAIEAFRQYKFSPALLNGKPVYATYREELTFAPPPLSLREMEEQQRLKREAEKNRGKKRPWP
jgi:TonB family protein